MIKKIIKFFIPTFFINIYSLRPEAKRICPLCSFVGYFKTFGRPPRIDSQCPKCNSVERHRLLFLSLKKKNLQKFFNKKKEILHFAAEPPLKKLFKKKYPNYKTADLFEDSDLRINIEKIDLPNNSLHIIIANHVLEHVNDLKSSKEIRRVLRRRGIFICTTPIIEGWSKTYENKSIKSPEKRSIHFGQYDHVRYYGSDFVERIEKSGLKIIDIFTSKSSDVIKYGLIRGEKVFVFIK